jgi:hypothetical protein
VSHAGHAHSARGIHEVRMTPHRKLLLIVLLTLTVPPGSTLVASDADEGRAVVRVRPATVALSIDDLAGHHVDVFGARAVGMFGTRVLVIDAAARLRPGRGYRDRVLVLVEGGEIRVRPELLVGSSVLVTGVARTLLGAQVTREVPWPAELDADRLERLEIRAVVLATSVRTPDGVELTDRTAPFAAPR